MLKRFVKWLDDTLADEGAWAVVKAVVGLVTLAVLLAAALGNTVVKAGVLLVAISLGLLLLVGRRNLLREVEKHKGLVSKYSQIVADDRHPSYGIITWEAQVAVEPNGDARRTVTIRAKVLNDLRVLRLVEGCGWPQPAKYRRNVRVKVHKLLVGDLRGASLSTTVAWLKDGQLVLIVHLPEPLKVDSEFTIAVEFVWPGMCAPLMRDREPDTFTVQFATPVAYARYQVTLPRSYDAYVEPVGFEEGQNGYAAGPAKSDGGKRVFLFEGVDLSEHEKLGMRLQLKGRGDPA